MGASSLATGVAKIIVKGKGSLLNLPALPIANPDLPLTVQLTSSNGECWEATYSSTVRNQESELRAKSD